MEFVKMLRARAHDPALHFWRTATGTEVDFLVGCDDRLVPVEVKATSTPRPGMAAGILAFRRDLPAKAAGGFVVHAGEVRLPLAPDVSAVPFGAF